MTTDYILWIVFILVAVFNIKGFARAAVKARRAGIVKVWFHKLILLVFVLAAVNIFFCVKDFKKSEGYRALAETAESLKGEALYKFAAERAEQRGEPLTDPEKYIADMIAKVKSSAGAYRLRAVTFILGAVAISGVFLGSVIFFTEEGLIYANIKDIEPITVLRRDGKLEVFGKNQLIGKKITRLSDNPNNLAFLGRYLAEEEEFT